jgi:hypothetical protein
MRGIDRSDQTARAISSARLKRLPSVHLRPINLVVSQGPFRDLMVQECSSREEFPHLDAFSGYLRATRGPLAVINRARLPNEKPAPRRQPSCVDRHGAPSSIRGAFKGQVLTPAPSIDSWPSVPGQSGGPHGEEHMTGFPRLLVGLAYERVGLHPARLGLPRRRAQRHDVARPCHGGLIRDAAIRLLQGVK